MEIKWRSCNKRTGLLSNDVSENIKSSQAKDREKLGPLYFAEQDVELFDE